MPSPATRAAITAPTAAIDLLHREIANPDTQWSLGTFGAIAEFARDRDEPVRLTRSDDGVSAITSRLPCCPPGSPGGEDETALHHNC